MFEIQRKDSDTRARLGVLTTAHGAVETPSYVIVGTHAEVRTLNTEDIPCTKTQMIIANTYHLWRDLGDKLDVFEGLHKRMGWNGTIMTDSGGFQVFSLGARREHRISKIMDWERFPDIVERRESLVRMTEEGAFFSDRSEELFLGPELSIHIQEKLGADIIFAFDECTSPFHDYDYNVKAMERTHRWAKKCFEAKTRGDQMLYGIVQGGKFRDLREKSARIIGEMPFDGFAVGGSFGKDEMNDVLNWTVPFLDERKPRHLLGVGRIEDLFEGVERGMDTFDCVIPTREARHGRLWTSHGHFQITKGAYKNDDARLEDDCECFVCAELRVRRSDLYALFKAKDKEAGRYATIHNVFFFNDLMKKIRDAIRENRFFEFKKEVLSG